MGIIYSVSKSGFLRQAQDDLGFVSV